MNIKANVGRMNKVNALFIGVFTDDKDKVNETCLSTAEKSKVNQILTSKKFKAKQGSSVTIHSVKSKTQDIIVVQGLGKMDDFTVEDCRKWGNSIYKKSVAEKWADIRVDLIRECEDDEDDDAARKYMQAFGEGFYLSDYKFDAYKSKKAGASALKSVQWQINKEDKTSATKSISHSRIISEGVNLARSLGNEPANKLYPESYAKQIKEMSKKEGLKCEIFDEKKLAKLKMGGILGVGMGSSRGPRLVIMEHKPKSFKNKKPIVFVGKGVTFDTGGISIKPPAKMDEMKFDMCGSAAVVGTMQAVARLKLPLHVIGMTPLAENMPGGKAQRPGDIITCYNGKTVEVLNTDAEGRLILADALAYSEKYKPECVVDAATLTGACAYTLDYAASGVMTNNEELVNRLTAAGEVAGERLWEFPLWKEYDEMIKGTYADIQNISKRSAGIQTAGCFLKHFGDHSPWAHIDIAGTAWGAPRHYNSSAGATGVGVRLFIEFLKSYL